MGSPRILKAGWRRMFIRTAAVATALLLGSVPSLLAQWEPYPTPGVPKATDGKPNLAGPAPKAANGKPDLSGVWLYMRPPGEPPPPPPPAPAPGATADIIPPAVRRSQFWNLGASFKD